MAKGKQGGKTKQKTTRSGKRLGIKLYGGQKIKTGAIIVRQRGAKFHPGEGTALGRDFTLYAKKSGEVYYYRKFGKKYVAVK